MECLQAYDFDNMGLKLSIWALLYLPLKILDTVRYFNLIVCIHILLGMTFFSHGQNGWVREPGGLYSQVAVSTFSSSNYYSTEGVLFDEGSTFRSQVLSLYGEYGITDRFTGVLDLPIIANSFNTTETVGGLGNLRLGMKYSLLTSVPIAIRLDVDIPTDDGIKYSRVKEPNSIGIVERINLPTSDGEINFWTTIATSYATSDGKTFGSIFSSINFRTQSFSHQWQSGLELGHLFLNKLYLIAKVKIQDRFSEKTNVSASFLYGEGTTFTSLGLTSLYKLNDHWRIVASYAQFSDLVADRRNIYDGPVFSLGVALER